MADCEIQSLESVSPSPSIRVSNNISCSVIINMYYIYSYVYFHFIMPLTRDLTMTQIIMSLAINLPFTHARYLLSSL